MAIIIKNKEQIEGIRKSCQLAAGALRFIDPEVKAGVTTEQLNQKLDEYIQDHGAIPAPLNYHGFPKATCTSLNEVVCHGIPDQTVLKEGDIINIDVTTVLDGYYGDTSKMFPVGDVSYEALRLMAIAQTCLDRAIEEVKPDHLFGHIGKVITEYATENGCSVVYQFCGHGTGLKFHEEPQIDHLYKPKSFDGRKMKPGMIFTVEPMINEGTAEAVIDKTDGWTARTRDGKLSAQYEHTVLVVPDGVEILTR
jgi:methionyl aminopeptidase